MESIIKESTNLYYEIDDCITELLKARLDKNTDKEREAICEMESLLVGTMQNISWLVGELKCCSKIKWQTGEPKEGGFYLITTATGSIVFDYWRFSLNRHYWGYLNKFDVKAWCKLSDIEPYKEETK